MVLMMNPSVGLTVVTSSFMICLTIVVLPALSRPLMSPRQQVHLYPESIGRVYSIRTRISLSLRRAFRNMDNIMADGLDG